MEKNTYNTIENVCVAAITSHSVYEVVALPPSLENTKTLNKFGFSECRVQNIFNGQLASD